MHHIMCVAHVQSLTHVWNIEIEKLGVRHSFNPLCVVLGKFMKMMKMIDLPEESTIPAYDIVHVVLVRESTGEYVKCSIFITGDYYFSQYL